MKSTGNCVESSEGWEGGFDVQPMVPVAVVGVLGTIPKPHASYTKLVHISLSVDTMQKTAITGMDQMLRKVFLGRLVVWCDRNTPFGGVPEILITSFCIASVTIEHFISHIVKVNKCLRVCNNSVLCRKYLLC